MQESPVSSVYAVVYRREGDMWAVQGEGWSEVHLYCDYTDQTYRLLSWECEDKSNDPLLNVNVSSSVEYVQKTTDFHKFSDGQGNVFGLGFHNDKKSLQQAKLFFDAIVGVIRPLRIMDGFEDELQINLPRPSTHRVSEPPRGVPLGRLTIGVPKPARLQKTVHPNSKFNVSDPISVFHDQHIEFDSVTKQFRGLPDTWKQALSKQFGTPLAHLPSSAVQGYSAPIPCILQTMVTYLESNHALTQEGIFRLAPDATECARVKSELDDGTFELCSDVNSVANCFKIFFREMPKQLLAVVPLIELQHCNTPAKAEEIVHAMPDPEQSVFLYLLDTCADFAEQAELNRMSPQNLAIVIAPNLFNIKTANPMEGVMISQKVVGFMYNAIQWRLQSRSGAPQ